MFSKYWNGSDDGDSDREDNSSNRATTVKGKDLERSNHSDDEKYYDIYLTQGDDELGLGLTKTKALAAAEKGVRVEIDTCPAGGTTNDKYRINNPRSSDGRNFGCCTSICVNMAGFLSTRRGQWTCGGITLFLLLFTTIMIAVSLNKLHSTEYGLEYNVHSKELDDLAKVGGLHAGPPGFEFIKFPATQITVDLPEDTCVSQDGLPVNFRVTFQYQIRQEWLMPVILKYRNYDKWSKVVVSAGNSAVHHSCADFQISNFQNQREQIQARMFENLRLKLEGPELDGVSSGLYAEAKSLQLQGVFIPQEYKSAVAEKQAAQEDIALANNQRLQEITAAQTELLSAYEEARKINNTAVNEATIILTEATLKAAETTYAFEKEAEVLVNMKESLNLTTDGVLAYMSMQLYENVDGLHVSQWEPAKLSRLEEL